MPETVTRTEPLYFDVHLFMCTNRRPDGARRGSCAAGGSEELRNYLKVRAKELGIEGLRVNAAGCLDRCELGPVMVIYPQGVWYGYRDRADLDEILERHLLGGEIVERLRLRRDQRPPEKTWPEKA